jgi:hypothetical protein
MDSIRFKYIFPFLISATSPKHFFHLYLFDEHESVWWKYSCLAFCDRFLKRPWLTVSRRFMNVANRVLWMIAIILKANKVNLFV